MTIKCINEEMTELTNKQERCFSFFLFYVIFLFHSFIFFYTLPSFVNQSEKPQSIFFLKLEENDSLFSPKTSLWSTVCLWYYPLHLP